MPSIYTWETNDKGKNIATVRWITLLIEDKNQFLADMHCPCSRLKPKRTEYCVFTTLTLLQSCVIWNECTYQKNVQGCPVVPWLWLGIWSSIGPSEQGFLRSLKRKSSLKSAGNTYCSMQCLDSLQPLGAKNSLSTLADATTQRGQWKLCPQHTAR